MGSDTSGRLPTERPFAALAGDFIKFFDLFGGQQRLDCVFHSLKFRVGLWFHTIHQGLDTLMGITNDGFDLVPLGGVQIQVLFHPFAERFQVTFPAWPRSIAGSVAGGAFPWASSLGRLCGVLG